MFLGMADQRPTPGPRGRPGPGANRLLGILPPSMRERLEDASERVLLRPRQTLLQEGDRIEHLYFPLSGVVSLVVLMRDGRGVDAAAVGFEGLVGVSSVLGEGALHYAATVQVQGEALRIATPDFQQLVAEEEILRTVALRYVGVLLFQTMRSAACNRLHEVEERLARWLLHTHDWVWEDRMALTQEFLAMMLGVRRATVTIAVGTLERAGIIAHDRGVVTIVDRRALERIACEDYKAIRRAFERLLVLPSR